jgi:uncharacterized protein
MMTKALCRMISDQFSLGADSIHGLAHWRRVEKFGLMLAEKTGADKHVISLFAYLHDSKREDEFLDLGHGARASDFVLKLSEGGDINLSRKQLEQLSHACRHHSEPDSKSDDITVMTCWDADRLDLWRVGMVPDPARLNTEPARASSMIEYSREINRS